MNWANRKWHLKSFAKIQLVCCFLIIQSVAGLKAQEKPIVVSQNKLGENSCGVCSVYNAMLNGNSAVRSLSLKLPGSSPEDRIERALDRYGRKPSVVYPNGQSRYTTERGMTPDDLTEFANDLMGEIGGPKVEGSYLDRLTSEPQERHLYRVYDRLKRSVEAGFPPIVDLQSYAARHSGQNYVWDRLAGHFVAIVEVQPILQPNEKLFWFRYADSLSGKVETAFASLEEARAYSATRNFKGIEDGSLQWRWLKGYPYLMITAPSLRLQTNQEPWYERTIIVLRHAVSVSLPEPKLH